MSEPVYIALGANLGDRAATLDAAVAQLGALPGTRVLRRASTLETDALLPEGAPAPQPRYLNTVVELATDLEPEALLVALLDLERRLGRVRTTKWAPRLIDLDIVLWGDRVVTSAALTVPHSELHRRAFVLVPLAELAPDAVHPLLHRTVKQLLAAVTPTPP